MKKYKSLTQLNYSLHKKGEIYDENYKHPHCNLTIGELAKKYPDAWELVEEEFVLPEKWYIKTDEESNDTICDWYDKVRASKTDRTIGNFYCVDGIDKPRGWMYYAPNKTNDYTEITFEQFKQYVLGMKEQEQQKEIVGWKLKEECKEYEKYALQISTATRFIPSQDGTLFSNSSYISEKLKQAGVLDLWFEPVYKEEETFCVGDWVTVEKYITEDYLGRQNFKIGDTFRVKKILNSMCAGVTQWIYDGFDNQISINSLRKATPEEIKAAQTPQITINGYKGEFFDWGVRFGCAEFDKDVFTLLYELKGGRSNRNIESVTIGKGTFSKEQIKQIAEFYLNKNK